jgi:hypothetical protein
VTVCGYQQTVSFIFSFDQFYAVFILKSVDFTTPELFLKNFVPCSGTMPSQCPNQIRIMFQKTFRKRNTGQEVVSYYGSITSQKTIQSIHVDCLSVSKTSHGILLTSIDHIIPGISIGSRYFVCLHAIFVCFSRNTLFEKKSASP